MPSGGRSASRTMRPFSGGEDLDSPWRYSNAASKARLRRRLILTSQRDSDARGAGNHHGPAPLCVFTAASIHSSLSHHPPDPPAPPSVREYTPARSAERHRPEAHWRNPLILFPAVTATGTTF